MSPSTASSTAWPQPSSPSASHCSSSVRARCPTRSRFRRDLNHSFADLAISEQLIGRDVTFVDAGASLAGPDGGWTWQLPCRPDETIWAGCTDGMIVVRGPDGRHLCPVDLQAAEPCPYWSSGAHRMAAVVAAVLRDRLGLTS